MAAIRAQSPLEAISGDPAAGALLSSKALLRASALTANAPLGVFVAGADGRTEYVNDRWCELAGLDRADVLTDGWVRALHQDDAERVLEEWTAAALDGRDSAGEFRFERPDGSVSWVEGFASALRDEAGNVLGWIGTCLDVTARKEAEEDLVRASEGFRAAFDNAPIGMALVSPEGRWLQVNDALCKLVGYEPKRLLELGIADLTHPDDLAATVERRARQLEGSNETRIEKRYVRADGETVWVAVSSTLVRDAAGEPLYTVAQIEDVGEGVRARTALAEAEERFRRAFDDAPIGMGLVRPDGRWLRANRTLTEITGYSEEQLLELTFQDITHPDDLDADLDSAARLLAGETRSYQVEKRYLRSDGQTIWVRLSVSLVRGADGEPLHFVSQIEDVSERRRAERELKRLAEHDSLMGLLNRRRLHEELQRELLRLRRQHRRAALLFLDVDKFKRVNDSLGHKAGDEVLQAVACRLTGRLRSTDVVARLGGDEFAVLLLDTGDPGDVHRIAGELAEAVRRTPVYAGEATVDVTVSIGVVLLSEDTPADADALIAADNAMYEAKRSGRDRIVLAPQPS